MIEKQIPDFLNTKTAFAHLSRYELSRAYWLFWIVQFPILVAIGTKVVRLGVALHLPVLWLLRLTVFKHFCGGESIVETKRVVEKLKCRKIGTILDYSMEGADKDADFEDTSQEILSTIANANGSSDYPFCVFKVTGLVSIKTLEDYSTGTPFDDAQRKAWISGLLRIQKICQKAFELNQPVLIDAEESWIQPAIDQIAHEMMQSFNRDKPIVFQTVQLYRCDRLNYLRNLVLLADRMGFLCGFKLVRGAYMEKERARALAMGYKSPIFDSKQETDAAFDEALAWCLGQLEKLALCIGTHNQTSIEKVVRHLINKNIPFNHRNIYFAQLLGMGDHLSDNLAQAGYNVAKYVPYGPVRAALPYLFRRAEENSSVSGQSGRELELLRLEMKRRSSLT